MSTPDNDLYNFFIAPGYTLSIGDQSWTNTTQGTMAVDAELLRQQDEYFRRLLLGQDLGQTIVPSEPIQPAEPESETMLANKFLVGCDPEFALIDRQGHGINFARYIQNGKLGYDHGGFVGELRPEPAFGTYTLVQRIKKLIQSPEAGNLPPGKWRGGAHITLVGERDHVDLGGHIHLAKNPFVNKKARVWTGNYDEDGQRVYVEHNVEQESDEHKELVGTLDHLTRRLEALDILPHVECEARRRGGGYGRFGDWRPQGHKDRMEYRTMASWLYDPKVAFACLTLAKLVAVDPKLAREALGRYHDFKPLVNWVNGFVHKDDNARRMDEKILPGGVKNLQADPDVNFRERWERLGF